jgi:glyoxylase-like metal-dependent hydrolase (beta-lactamase superfamily II)
MTNPGQSEPVISVVRADNPGPMTLEGTNTWVVGAPTATGVVLIDPGPELPEHARRVRDHLAERELAVELILLTHGHLDHSEAAATFARQLDAPVRAVDPQWATAHPLSMGEVIEAAGLQIESLATPGHSSDSVTFLVPGAMFTGDTVLGRGTTVVAHPDGRLSDYLQSLEVMYQRAKADAFTVLPGHGPVHDDAAPVLRAYLEHRHERLRQVAAVVDERFPGLRFDSQLAHTATDPNWLGDVVRTVVEEVYFEVPDDVKAAAAHSVRAQVLYLVETGTETVL